MRALDRKLFRELRRHWVQIASIALVMGCGTMTIMGLRSTLTSIRAARDDYFDVYRFGDVFAHLERAPDVVAQRIARIRGVGAIETRVVRDVRLDVPGLSEPAIGHMVSIPAVRRSMLNELLIRRGRWIAPGSPREVLVSDRFAEVNHLAPGDSLSAVINGGSVSRSSAWRFLPSSSSNMRGAVSSPTTVGMASSGQAASWLEMRST
jgi:putative ABC transport system permease protein